jgi:hypothetical protein
VVAAFLPRRAHVVRAASLAPIYFRRGDRAASGVSKEIEKKRLDLERFSVDFWASFPVSDPRRAFTIAILPWALPLAGFAGTQLCNQLGSTPIGSPASGEIVRPG